MGEEGFSLLSKKVNGGSQQNGEYWQVSSLVPFFSDLKMVPTGTVTLENRKYWLNSGMNSKKP